MMSDSTIDPSPSPLPPPTNLTKSSSKRKPTILSSSFSRSSPLSSHLQMIELKNRILTSLNKLADRDTHQIAIDELEKISQTLASESIPMFLNCLFDAAESQQKPIVRKQSIRLLANLSLYHLDSLASQLPKIVAHIAKRLKDADSGVREACQSAVGMLSEQYLREGEKNNEGFLVGLMVKPFLDALTEQNKTVQVGSVLCLAKLIECAADPPVAAFQKLCPKVYKLLGSPSFFAKAALLTLVSRLAQVGALVPQSMPVFLQCIHECLESSDWSTRKAAADVLSDLATHSSHLIGDGGASTITALEACHFDKVKPVRDSMTEALQLWKNVMGKEQDENPEDKNAVSHEGRHPELNETSEKLNLQKSSPSGRSMETDTMDPSKATVSVADSLSKLQICSRSDKTVLPLKKKPPVLNDKELNPGFFQKLESRNPDDLPVEVVLPRRHRQTSQSQSEESPVTSACNMVSGSSNVMPYGNAPETDTIDRRPGAQEPKDVRDRWSEQRSFSRKNLRLRMSEYNDKNENSQRESCGSRMGFSNAVGLPDNSMVSGKWLGIQRQLAHLERQQASIMNMLQGFMGGSHDNMVTLENRVLGLERVVEDMARDVAFASGRRGSNSMLGFEGSPVGSIGKYGGHSDYASGKLGRNGAGRMVSDRFPSSVGNLLGAQGRDPLWRSDAADGWGSFGYGSPRTGHFTSRRAINGSTGDGRINRAQIDVDQVGSRRGWDKGPGTVRLGEGPSARSVWQASKDEATLEAIRVAVAGEEDETTRKKSRVAIPELAAEPLTEDNPEQEKGLLQDVWSRAMDSLHEGDVDSAYADVLSTGDDLLLVKLMEISGPVMDQLSDKTAGKALDALAQFLQEEGLLDMGLCWIQQLVDLLVENGVDFLGFSYESKKALLLSLDDASMREVSDEWEGVPPDEILLQLASSWQIDLKQLKK